MPTKAIATYDFTKADALIVHLRGDIDELRVLLAGRLDTDLVAVTDAAGALHIASTNFSGRREIDQCITDLDGCKAKLVDTARTAGIVD